MEKSLKTFLNIFSLWLWRLFIAYAIIFAVAGTIGAVVLYKIVMKPISEVKVFKGSNPEETVFMTTYREELREKGRPDSLYRLFVSIDSISPYLHDAVIAAEDDNFYLHPGFDPLAILKAFEYNAARRRIIRGGSTISQQLAKNLFLTKKKTFERKYQEVFYTVLIEYFLGKKRIMELYLNYAQWGKNIFGCEAAAQAYFKKSCSDLTPDEAVRMAAVLAKPARLSPLRFQNSYMQKRLKMIITNLYHRHKKTFRAGKFPVPVKDSMSIHGDPAFAVPLVE